MLDGGELGGVMEILGEWITKGETSDTGSGRGGVETNLCWVYVLRGRTPDSHERDRQGRRTS